jgi:outer membrane immunogenic protein
MNGFPRKLLLSIVSAVALSAAGAAGAADMPLKAPLPPPPPVWSWTGFYLGAHVGAGWGAKDWDEVEGGIPLLHDSFPVNGFLGGGQLGYRWQTGMWVWGIEGSGSGAGITGQNACFEFEFNCKSTVDWLATATVQVGWAVDHALLYIKGGAAWAGDHHVVTFSDGDPFGSHNETRLGPLFGAGITYAFDPHWSAFIEYNYMDFGTRTNTISECPTCEFLTFDISQQIHVIKAGVNWKWDGWAGGY